MAISILVICQLPPPVHGSNVMAERFVTALENLGHKLVVVQKTFSRDQKEVGKLSCRKFMVFPLLVFNLIYQIITNKPALCIYFIAVKRLGLFVDSLLLSLVRLFGIPYVLYFHGKGYLKYYSDSKSFFNSLVKKTLSKALAGFVLGQGLKGDVNAYISDGRLYVLPNSIPDIDLSQVNLNGRNVKPIKVLFLSNLVRAKGAMEFLQMAKKVVEKRKDVRFILAGPQRSEDFLKEIQAFIRQEGLTEFVSLPGGVYGSEKARLFQESNIFVFPTFREAFGLVNLEAMQWGLPVISSDEGAIPEIVRHGINGYIVDQKKFDSLSDCVLRLIEDAGLRRRMGKAGRELYERLFTPEAYEKRIEMAINSFWEVERT